MVNFAKDVFSMTFIGYLIYILAIIYWLIPMFVQIIFSYCIEKRQIWKVALMVFLTQGFVVPLAFIYRDIINSIYEYRNTWGYDFIIKKEISFDVPYSLLLNVLLICIGFFVYRSIGKRMNYKKWIAILFGYLINVSIIVFMMLRFKIMADAF